MVKTYLESDLAQLYELIHITTHKDGRRLKNLFLFLWAMIRFLFLSVVKPAKIIHLHSSAKGSFYRKLFFAIFGKLFGFKVIFHIHSGHFYSFYEKGGWIRKRLVTGILNLSDCVIVLTDSWLKTIREITNNKRILVLKNPVNFRHFSRRTGQALQRRKQRQILYMGAIIRNKGVYDLISCIPKVIQQIDIPLKFIFAGDREIEKAKSMCRKLGIENHVEFPGWVTGERKYDFLINSDLLVLPSYYEGLPIIILEAMAAGLPIIATPVGGIPELVKDGVNGILVPPGDINRLSDAILRLLYDKKLLERMIKANRMKAEYELDAGVISKRLTEIYDNLIS